MEKTLFSGWVQKRPHGIMGYFLQKRFLVLTDLRLCYFEDEPKSGIAIVESDYDPKRHIYLDHLISVSRADERGGMLVVTADRKYTLVFGSDAERDEWLSAVIAAREAIKSGITAIEPAVAAASCAPSQSSASPQSSPVKQRSISADSAGEAMWNALKSATGHIVTNVSTAASTAYGSIKTTVVDAIGNKFGLGNDDDIIDDFVVPDVEPVHMTYPKVSRELIVSVLRLERMFRSMPYDRACQLVDIFYDNLYLLPSKQRSDVAKSVC